MNVSEAYQARTYHGASAKRSSLRIALRAARLPTASATDARLSRPDAPTARRRMRPVMALATRTPLAEESMLAFTRRIVRRAGP